MNLDEPKNEKNNLEESESLPTLIISKDDILGNKKADLSKKKPQDADQKVKFKIAYLTGSIDKTSEEFMESEENEITKKIAEFSIDEDFIPIEQEEISIEDTEFELPQEKISKPTSPEKEKIDISSSLVELIGSDSKSSKTPKFAKIDSQEIIIKPGTMEKYAPSSQDKTKGQKSPQISDSKKMKDFYKEEKIQEDVFSRMSSTVSEQAKGKPGQLSSKILDGSSVKSKKSDGVFAKDAALTARRKKVEESDLTDFEKRFTEENASYGLDIEIDGDNLKSLEQMTVDMIKSKKKAEVSKKDYDSGEVPDLLNFGDIHELDEIPLLEEVPEIAPLAPVEKKTPKDPLKGEVESVIEEISKGSAKDELKFFGKSIEAMESLSKFKPVIEDMLEEENINYKNLVALYKIATRYLQGDLSEKQRAVEESENKHKNFKMQIKRFQDAMGSKSQIENAPNVSGDENFTDATVIENIVVKESNPEMEEELNKKQKLIDELENRLEKMMIDFKNLRERQSSEVDRLTWKFQEQIFIDLLPVIDNLDRAVEFSRNTGDLKSIIKGFELIRDDFIKFVKKYGLEEIPAQGEKFDPYLHESLVREETTKFEDDMIIQILRKGYKLGEKVIRHTQVKTALNRTGEFTDLPEDSPLKSFNMKKEP